MRPLGGGCFRGLPRRRSSTPIPRSRPDLLFTGCRPCPAEYAFSVHLGIRGQAGKLCDNFLQSLLQLRRGLNRSRSGGHDNRLEKPDPCRGRGGFAFDHVARAGQCINGLGNHRLRCFARQRLRRRRGIRGHGSTFNRDPFPQTPQLIRLPAGPMLNHVRRPHKRLNRFAHLFGAGPRRGSFNGRSPDRLQGHLLNPVRKLAEPLPELPQQLPGRCNRYPLRLAAGRCLCGLPRTGYVGGALRGRRNRLRGLSFHGRPELTESTYQGCKKRGGGSRLPAQCSAEAVTHFVHRGAQYLLDPVKCPHMVSGSLLFGLHTKLIEPNGSLQVYPLQHPPHLPGPAFSSAGRVPGQLVQPRSRLHYPVESGTHNRRRGPLRAGRVGFGTCTQQNRLQRRFGFHGRALTRRFGRQ